MSELDQLLRALDLLHHDLWSVCMLLICVQGMMIINTFILWLAILRGRK